MELFAELHRTCSIRETLFLHQVKNIMLQNKFMIKSFKITSRLSLTLCSTDPTPELKTNMVKPRKRRLHFIASDLDTDWTIP